MTGTISMSTRRPVLLLTGAAGVLGQAFIQELAPDHDILYLRRRSAVADPKVSAVAGDLTADRLGLAPAQFERLAERIDVILHAAAATSWSMTAQEVVSTNVAGTERMLRLADRAQAPLYYVSTAFTERPVLRGDDSRFAGPKAYVDSKITAERLVRESGQPTAIVRPSIVIGDASDGHMSAFQGIHKAIRAVVRGIAPMIPAHPSALVDVVPQDVVAEATAALIRRREVGEYWLTAGSNALSVQEMVDACLAVARRCGTDPGRPRLVPTDTVDRLLIPLMADVIPPSMRRRFDDLITLMLLFQSTTALPTSLPAMGFGDRVSRPALLAAFERGVEYWATTRGLVPTGTLSGAVAEAGSQPR
jgi:nucleoside-diphosphate-sugar epimerase